MTKQCVLCSKTFVIEPDDQVFYDKIQVPAPKLCPDCRLQRRLAWRNERSLYLRQCDLCHKNILALYPTNSPYTVYCHDCYWGDHWSSFDYGRAIDWSRPFFDQFVELYSSAPHAAAYNDNPENSDYVNYCYQAKNDYLVFGSNFTENCYYCYHLDSCNQCVDCLNSDHLELCSSCVDCSHCYNTHYAQECHNMRDSYFCFDCRTSADCFGSTGLRNKQYVLFNKQLDATTYHKQLEYYLAKNSSEQLADLARQLRYKVPQRPAMITKCEQSSGDHLQNCSNAQYCFDSAELTNCKYIIHCTPKAFDSMDVYGGGVNIERCYEFLTGYGQNLRFSMLCWKSVSNLDYCMLTNFAHDCFGCFSLRNGQYFILNTAYNQSDYQKLRQRLIKHMQNTGEYGEFFPIDRSIFAYNETAAQLDFPLSSKDVIAQQWSWTEAVAMITGQQTADITSYPQLARQTSAGLAGEIFQCQQCQRNYKIISQELDFYKKQNVFLPRQCSNCRFHNLYKLRSGYHIWQRQCMCTQTGHGHHGLCMTKFETTYSPNRKEIVYCESCYQKEIY